MNNAIKLGRFGSQSSTFLSSSSSLGFGTRSSGRVRFVHVSNSKDPQPSKFGKMDINKNKKDDQKDTTNINVMEESFGEGYATRSDEEGFGGVYGGNREDNAEMKIAQDPAHHDNTQGSEVKEKERARNQSKVA